MPPVDEIPNQTSVLPIPSTFGVILTANTLADVSLINDTNLTNGTKVWVKSRKRYFVLDKFATAANVDGEIVSTLSGTGKWVSDDTSTSFLWTLVTLWGIDPVNGNDDNVGSPASPLKTGEELQRRWGTTGRNIGNGASVTVQILNPGANISVVGVRTNVAAGAAIVLQGMNATPLFTGTLTGQNAINRGSPGNSQRITAAGLAASWTASGGVDQRVRLTSGATLGTAFIMVDDEAGFPPVPRRAETTPFIDANGTPFTPAGNEDFVVESLQTIASLTIDEGAVSFLSVQVTLKDLSFATSGGIRGGFLLCFGSKCTSLFQCFGTTFVDLFGCWMGFVATGDAASFFGNACGFTSSIVSTSIGQTKIIGDSFVRDATLNNSVAATAVDLIVGPAFWENTTAGKPLIDLSRNQSAQSMGCNLTCTGVIYGSTAGAATVGVLLGKGSRVDLGGFTNTFTSTGNNWQFGSTGKTHAQLPFVDQFDVGFGPVANANMAQVL